MNFISKQQANWIADLLELGHIHYEMTERRFGNAFYQNGVFIEETDDNGKKEHEIKKYSREEFVHNIMTSPRQRFSRFLDMVN